MRNCNTDGRCSLRLGQGQLTGDIDTNTQDPPLPPPSCNRKDWIHLQLHSTCGTLFPFGQSIKNSFVFPLVFPSPHSPPYRNFFLICITLSSFYFLFSFFSSSVSTNPLCPIVCHIKVKKKWE